MEMTNMSMPELFNELIQKGFLSQSNIFHTEDGFYAVNHRLVQLGGGYLYAVPDRDGYAYGVFTMSDQDSSEPGVVIAFAAIDPGTMQPSTLCHKAIRAYFRHPKAQGAYLIARLYVEHIIAAAQSRHIQLPYYYPAVYVEGRSNRLPNFIAYNNEDAVHTVCDQETIYIRDLTDVSEFEKLAILATHTGCTSFYSFAAGVQYQAGKGNAAKLSVCDETAPYHSADSNWVKKQKKYHNDI